MSRRNIEQVKLLRNILFIYRIFNKPLYCGALIDQSLLLNIISDDENVVNEAEMVSNTIHFCCI